MTPRNKVVIHAAIVRLLERGAAPALAVRNAYAMWDLAKDAFEFECGIAMLNAILLDAGSAERVYRDLVPVVMADDSTR